MSTAPAAPRHPNMQCVVCTFSFENMAAKKHNKNLRKFRSVNAIILPKSEGTSPLRLLLSVCDVKKPIVKVLAFWKGRSAVAGCKKF